MELAGTELRHYTSGMITYCQTFNYIQKLVKLHKPLDVSQIYHFFVRLNSKIFKHHHIYCPVHHHHHKPGFLKKFLSLGEYFLSYLYSYSLQLNLNK